MVKTKSIVTETSVKSLLQVDASNLFHCVNTKFPGRKLSYDYLASKCGRTFKSIVYGAQMGNEADYFIKKVQSYGFSTKFKKPKTFGDGVRKADWDIGITVDAFRYVNRYERLILCTGDGDFKPLVEYLASIGKDVYVYGCNISRDLRDTATYWEEVTSEWLH